MHCRSFAHGLMQAVARIRSCKSLAPGFLTPGFLMSGFLMSGLLALGACGPIPVDRAEQLCLQQAYGSTGPHGRVSLGVAGNRHGVYPTTSLELGISSDWIAGRDPSAVFDRCVLNRSGRMPTRPLSQQPGWGGG